MNHPIDMLHIILMQNTLLKVLLRRRHPRQGVREEVHLQVRLRSRWPGGILGQAAGLAGHGSDTEVVRQTGREKVLDAGILTRMRINMQ